jgi:transposase InsO family protein
LHGYLDKDIRFNSDINLLVGINGSGKTSVLNIISWLLQPAIPHLCVTEFKELVASMSRKGNCYHNAFIESFWSSLKYEVVYDQRFATFAEARCALFNYIEIFYNRIRLHSSLAYCGPTNFESQLKPNHN